MMTLILIIKNIDNEIQGEIYTKINKLYKKEKK